jgi:hypothetical protein
LILSDISQLIIIQALNVILLHERIDVLLDVGDFWWKAGFDLRDDLFDQVHVLEFLAAFHDTDNDGLKNTIC